MRFIEIKAEESLFFITSLEIYFKKLILFFCSPNIVLLVDIETYA